MVDLPVVDPQEPQVQYNSAEELKTVDRLGTGRWAVTLPGLGGSAGRGSVVASNINATATACRVTGWEAGIVARVACRNRLGALGDRPFALTYLKRRGLKGEGEEHVAYLLADQPSTAHYLPRAGFRSSTGGSTLVIDRIDVGVYKVTLEGIPLGGSAQVTPFGSGKRRCVVAGIRKTGLPQRITVRCFTADGSAPADAKFTLSYTR